MRFTLLLVPLLLAGCGGGASRSDTSTTSGANPDPKPVPVEGNPNRIHQLKDLKTATIKVAGRDLRVWLMDTDSKRQEGMMFLTDAEVPSDCGMLFVFPLARKQSFWMENTLIPLDIAYVGTDKKILNIQTGQPRDRTGLPSDGPSQYVIEVKAGQAGPLGIVKGAVVEIPASIKAKD